VGALGPQLLVRTRLDAQENWFSNRLKADLTIEGTPELSADGKTLGFGKIGFTLETQNRLATFAAWLLQPAILAYLQQSLSIDVGHQLDDARTKANGEIKNKFANSALQPTIVIQSIQAARCILSGSNIIALFRASGTAKADLSF
jgi:hypothetical protein